MAVVPLQANVIRQISSAQIVSSISSVVKELMENAIDAGANCIDVKLVSIVAYPCQVERLRSEVLV